jgi:hypothetical protein
MSLRTQIRDAVDEVSPPAVALEDRVATFVLADGPTRKAGRSRALFRAPLALVAAVLLVALVGGLILAGRYWRDLNLPPQTLNQTELKVLESRPLLFPVAQPGAQCPASPLQIQLPGLAYGDGPLLLTSGDSWTMTDWGNWVDLNFIYVSSEQGPILLRAKDLQSERAMVVFAQNPLSPSALNATGSLLGTDHAYDRTLQMRSEAVAQHPVQNFALNQGPRPSLRVLLGVAKGTSFCIGFQVDGPTFTENFVVLVSPYF